MRILHDEIGISTTNGAPANGSESTSAIIGASFALASESEFHEWLFHAARALLGKDAGYALHLLTGYPASSCYAYVAKNQAQRRRQPEHFTRSLIHHDEGEPFFRAFMAGCAAPWWIELNRHADIGRKVLDLTRGG